MIYTRISTADLGTYYLKYFLLWALVENQNKGAFAANIIKARVDANKDGIQDGLQHYAKQYGLTIAQLETAVLQLNSEGKSISQIHEQLSQDSSDEPEEEEQ